MLEYLHEDTVMHLHIYYEIQRGKRKYYETKPKKSLTSSTFEYEAFMYPPAMLSPLAWIRYGYSCKDVFATFEKMEACFIWSISLFLLLGKYEPEAASAAVRPTYQSPFHFLFISRKNILDVLIEAVKPMIQKKSTVLCKERSDHFPLLPKVYVSAGEFENLKLLIPDREPSFCWTVVYPSFYEFNGIKLVTISYDQTNDLIYMVRIIYKSTYDSMHTKPTSCFITLPTNVIVNKVQYVLHEEACFFSKKR